MDTPGHVSELDGQEEDEKKTMGSESWREEKKQVPNIGWQCGEEEVHCFAIVFTPH